MPVTAQQIRRTAQLRLAAARELVEVEPDFDRAAGVGDVLFVRPVRPASGSQAPSARHRGGAR
ncbi:hypothetical protein ACRJ4W_51440 [Streptomyces sp. GLT-R25]